MVAKAFCVILGWFTYFFITLYCQTVSVLLIIDVTRAILSLFVFLCVSTTIKDCIFVMFLTFVLTFVLTNVRIVPYSAKLHTLHPNTEGINSCRLQWNHSETMKDKFLSGTLWISVASTIVAVLVLGSVSRNTIRI